MTEPARKAPPTFSPATRTDLLDLLAWRRDVRAFDPRPLPTGMLDRLVEAACLAPSVGLSEPWRFVVVERPELRRTVRANFEACNAEALAAQDETRQSLYARLKLAGLDQAPVQIAAFADGACDQGHGLGCRTMPEAVDYSVAIAIHTLWLAARLEGIGLGWVSILEPASLAAALDVPASWRLIGYLCLGYPKEAHDTPTLQREGWETRRSPSCRILYR